MEMQQVAGISRRQLVQGVAAVAAMATFAGCSSKVEDKTVMALAKADKTWDTDIAVLGSGLAGLSASIEAAQAGAKVILLEKENVLGGNTNVAEGVFAVGSSLQKELGITANVSEILAQEYEFHHYMLNPKLWEEIAYNSAANIDWLLNVGVKFETVSSPGAGPKTWHIFKDGHGKTAVDVLGSVAEKLGVEIVKSTPGTSLLSSNGTVTGVRAKDKDGSLIDVNATAVILATGGLAANAEELVKRTNAEASKYTYRGMPGQTGDGIRMAEEVGMGKALHITPSNIGTGVPRLDMTNQFGSCIGNEPTNLWVNQDGVRFVPESFTFYLTTAANAVQQQTRVFSIMDKTAFDRLVAEGPILGLGEFVKMGVPCTQLEAGLKKAIEDKNENVFVGDTVEELAKAIGVDPKVLAATVEEYNSFCDSGVDTQYAKTPFFLRKLSAAPFYAGRLTANTGNTLGGVRVNTNMEVIKEDGTEILGLYAAGMECSGYSGETYGVTMAGSTTAIALGTGRIAGMSAAAYAKV
ncbi:MAG: FAD-dependent oxidoreductase [Coriobacteriia bacterium]